MDPLVIEDILPKRLYNDLEVLFSSPAIDWCFNADMTYSGNNMKNLPEKLRGIILNNPDFVKTPGVATRFVENLEFHNEVLFRYVQPITYLLEEFLHKNHPDILPEDKKLIVLRAKANMLFRNNTTEDQCEMPHLDSVSSDLNFVYYVNESDGDTFLFNEKVFDIFDKFTINKRVTPKPNRGVLFKNERWHTGSSPIKSPFRITINFNYIIK